MKRKKPQGRPQRTMTPSAQKTSDQGTKPASAETGARRHLGTVILSWALLSMAMCLLAWQNLSVPGFYYDEAVFAGMAKDFVTGQIHGQHMPGNETWQLFGRPFPFFVQTYLGALKCWILIPALYFFGNTVAVVRATNLFCGSIALLFFML